MAKAIDISLEVTQVATAYTGRDVRQAIVDALNATQNAINEMNMPAGSQTLIVPSETTMATTTLNLPFTPTQNTQIICSLREVSAPTVRRLCVETFFTSNNLIVALTNAESASATVPQGEYIIDWIVTKP